VPSKFAEELTKARDSTFLYLKHGPCSAVRIGNSAFTQQQVIDNILHSISFIIDKIQRKWKNVQAIFLKTHDSVALPLYNSLPTNQKLPSLDLSSGTETKSVSKKSKKRKQAPKSTSQKDTQEQSQVNQSEGEKQKKLKTLSTLLQETSSSNFSSLLDLSTPSEKIKKSTSVDKSSGKSNGSEKSKAKKKKKAKK